MSCLAVAGIRTLTLGDAQAGNFWCLPCVVLRLQGVEYVNQGHNPIPLQRGIQKAARIMMDEVKKLAKPVNGFGDLLNIATVATSGNASMGEVIAKAFDKLGNHTAIVLENNPSQEDNVG